MSESNFNFKFNTHGVCINPLIIHDLQSKYVHASLELASHNGYWTFGFSFDTPYSGGGFSAAKSDALRSKHTQIQAIKESISHMFQQFKNTIKDTNSCKPKYLNEHLTVQLRQLERWEKSLILNGYSIDHILKLKNSNPGEQASLFS